MTDFFTVTWFICGFVHYGLWVGHFQTKYPLIAKENYWRDRVEGACLAVFGPIALVASLLCCTPYKWRL